MATNHKRLATAADDRAAAKAEREAVKALKADLQAVIDGLTNASTLADVRASVKDIARITRRLVALPHVAG